MEKDLGLLENVFLKIAMAESDEQFEKLVSNYLCPIILKLSSEHKPVQDKVMGLLNHIKKRLDSRPIIQLPMTSLMNILKSSSSSMIIKNFSFIYFKMGFPRLSPSAQVNLLPCLIILLNGTSSQQTDTILQLYSSALVHLSFPIETSKLNSMLPSTDNHKLRSNVLEYLFCFIVLPYSYKSKLPPFGMKQSQFKRITSDKEINPDYLEKLKLSILKLLCSGACSVKEIILHLVVGMSDTRHTITDYCENQWRQSTTLADYEHSDSVIGLQTMYLGSEDKTDSQSAGGLRFKISAMKFFNKSIFAANNVPICIKIVFDGLFGVVTNSILRVLTMEFAIHIIHRATPAKLTALSPLLMTALNKIIDQPESKEEKKLLLYAYSGVGLLAKCSPQLFQKDPKHILKLMDALKDASDRETRLSIQECLSGVAKSYAGTTGDGVVILEAMILDNIDHQESHVRWGAAYCSRIIFPFNHIPSRYISLLACGDQKEEVKEEGKKGLLPNQDNPNEEGREHPGFAHMTEYIYIRAKSNMEGDGVCYSVASGKLPYRPMAMNNQLQFLHHCLLFSAECGDQSTTTDLTQPLENNHVVKLTKYLTVLCDDDGKTLDQYLSFIKYALSPGGDSDLHGVAVSALLHIILASPPHIATSFISEIDHVKTYIHSTNAQTREAAARLVCYLVSLLPQEEIISFSNTVCVNASSGVYTVFHGAVVTLGHLGAVFNKLLQSSPSLIIDRVVHDIVYKILLILSGINNHVLRYACLSLGEVARSGPLPVISGNQLLLQHPIFGKLEEFAMETTNVENVIRKLEKIMRETTDIILKERCIRTLGLMCIGDTNLPYKETIIEILFSLKEDKQIDLQFTVGEAIACVIAGKYCQSATDPWDYRTEEESKDDKTEVTSQCDEKMENDEVMLQSDDKMESDEVTLQSDDKMEGDEKVEVTLQSDDKMEGDEKVEVTLQSNDKMENDEVTPQSDDKKQGDDKMENDEKVEVTLQSDYKMEGDDKMENDEVTPQSDDKKEGDDKMENDEKVEVTLQSDYKMEGDDKMENDEVTPQSDDKKEGDDKMENDEKVEVTLQSDDKMEGDDKMENDEVTPQSDDKKEGDDKMENDEKTEVSLKSDDKMDVNLQNDNIMDTTLTRLLEELAFSSAPVVRQSSCIWMLSILKNISKHPLTQSYLRKFQMAFVNLLADTDDMIQEVASRGLVLVYDLSEPSQKESLVDVLVGTLLEGRKGNQPINKDSKVFGEGALGKTPTGSRLTTYKELCSLASDLNQPDLIYKFMHLANHNALWNSKKGAAFGMTTIATHAKEQLAPYLPTLVPRLFRYKYDPIPRIQLSMSSIWESIVTDNKGTVELYYGPIIKDLIKNLGSSQWRNREASCLALRDLLVVYQSTDVSCYLDKLWELSLRARDDIKETVRKSADNLCKTLINVTVKLCEKGSSKMGSNVIQSVLPVLLKTGMASPAQEVRALSLLGIVKIAEDAGPLLKPHIPQLVPFLLESMSSLEPQALNTLSLRLGDEGGLQEQLETIRIAASKTSPMMKVCNLCVPHIEPGVLTELVPQLIAILKSGVGLGTKVGCSQFVINVLQDKTDYLTPHDGKILSALLSGLSDRSTAVRKNYARAIGHIMKVAKSKNINKVVEKLKKLYYESGDVSIQSSVAYAIHAMSQYSPDTAKNITVDLAPLVFLAMHGTVNEDDSSSEDTIKLWNEVWQELVPNTTSGVRLYLNELIAHISPNVSAQSWEIKKTAASALSTIAEKAGSTLGPPHLATLLNTLLNGLQGRLWNGKESLMKSLKTVCVSCSTAVRDRQDDNQPEVNTILSCLYVECGKKDLLYKTTAIETTGHVINSLELDGFKRFYEIVSPLVQAEDVSSEKMEVTRHEAEVEEEREKKTLLLNLHVVVFKAIGMSWPSSTFADTQRAHCDQVWRLLSNALPNNNWKIQESILNSLVLIMKKTQFTFLDEDLKLFSTITFPNLCQCLGNPRYFVIRDGALNCLDKLTLLLEGHKQLSALEKPIIKEMCDAVVLVNDNQLKELVSVILKRLKQYSS